MSEIIKCKYAGDPEDYACKVCDGITTTLEPNVTIEATKCAGYEPMELADNDTTIGNSFGEDIPWEDVKKEDIEKMSINGSITNETAQMINNPSKDIANEIDHNLGEITEITAGTGISVELNNVWYKFDYSETRKINPKIDIQQQKENLWTEVFNQVDKALDDTKKSLNI